MLLKLSEKSAPQILFPAIHQYVLANDVVQDL